MKILSEKDSQLLQLINILYLNGPTSLDELKSAINSSTSKLMTSISLLNDILSPCKIINQSSVFYLFIPHDASYDLCISKILNYSLECSIVESIFFEKHKTYLSLAEELHVSESTVKRSIRHLNAYFPHYNIIIKTKPLRLEGDERNIRYFFILYFSSKYNLNSLPFEKEITFQLEQFYNLGTKMFRNTVSTQDRSNFTLFTSISYERERNGHKLLVNDPSKVKFLLSTINSLPRKLTKLNKITSKNEMDFWVGTFSIFTNNNTLNSTFFSSKKEKDYFKNTGITRFLLLFCTVFKIELTDKELRNISKEIYEILFGFLKPRNAMKPLNNHYQIFYESNDFFMDSYKELTKEIFFNCFPGDLHHYFDFLFFSITTNFPKLLDNFFSSFAKVTITVYIDFDFAFAKYIKSKLEKTIPGSLTFFLIDSSDNLNDQSTFAATDIFITNVFSYEQLEIDKAKLYLVSWHLSSADIENITTMVRNIYKNNYNHIISDGEKELEMNFKYNS
ncbi:helix-turn-helix domain-containing protein [Enterococcus sp. AZ012]|uniref:helix-turn-helix domain-containing protein n=1 Tax=unclassified Enterococcus TaxID=2608891 RepID=UPI003D2C8667